MGKSWKLFKWGKSARTRLYPCHIKLNSLKVAMMRSPLLSITTSRPLLLIHYTHKLNMSTKPQFLCMVHDHPGTMQKRIEVRQAHLSVVGTNKAVVAGGNHQPNPLSTIDGNKNWHGRRILLERPYSRGSDAFCGTCPAKGGVGLILGECDYHGSPFKRRM